MRKIIPLVVLFVCGCTCPQYYSYIQELDLQIPEGCTVNGNSTDNGQLSVFRTFFNKDVVIKKEGYKDYHLKLTSNWTNEKWGYYWAVTSEGSLSAGDLYTFPNTRAWANWLAEGELASSEFWIGLLMTPPAFVLDIFNMVIGVPSAALINPWTKYQYEKEIIMEPLMEKNTSQR